MGHGWIIDVITDLRRFADKNGLHGLAANLADTADLAAIELASLTDRSTETPPAGTGRYGDRSRTVSGTRRVC